MSKKIVIKGARVNNLKNISLEIPRDQLVVITGLSGSGKSSLAFDTIYAEGQRRYVESLSAYARQFLGLLDKPDVDQIEGLSPTIAIDQRSVTHNPRSTVGTVTEIYDYLRILFAKIGHPHCPSCGEELFKQTTDQIAEKILTQAAKGEWLVLVPLIKAQKGEHKKAIDEMARNGYKQVRVDGELLPIEVASDKRLDRIKRHTIEMVFNQPLNLASGSLGAGALTKPQIIELVKTACDLGDGFFTILNSATSQEIHFSQYYACPKDEISLPAFEPRSFSFNSPQGACAACSGLGTKLILDPELVIPNAKLSFNQGAIRPWSRIFANQTSNIDGLGKVAIRLGFSMDAPVESLTDVQRKIILLGDDKYEGVIPSLEKKHLETDSDYVRSEIEKYMRVKICASCGAKRLRPESLGVTVLGKSIAELVNCSITDLHTFFGELSKMCVGTNGNGHGKKTGQASGAAGTASAVAVATLTDRETKIAEQLVREVITRCQLLIKVGLNYLTLDRSAVSLSGGEAQRIRLATQIGAMLVGVVYVLDEPSIG
ncbi:excinuclease ABC subunit UvrA, partial [Candidatus Uhrbacteria bacterium]|nr:excinuclease ABC subunit UvrA [Candidatus Uhrbacteria bacterium]